MKFLFLFDSVYLVCTTNKTREVENSTQNNKTEKEKDKQDHMYLQTLLNQLCSRINKLHPLPHHSRGW